MKVLMPYIKLVDFMADMLGSDSEVVLHDLRNIDNSVVAIRNGHISGRTLGAPATDLILKVMKEVKYTNTDHLCNYRGYSKTGSLLKSSSFFIRDDKQQIIGVLCVNMDCDKYDQLNHLLTNFLSFNQKPVKFEEDEEEITETFNHSVEELTLDNIQPIIEEMAIDPKRMNASEKIEVVKKLYDKGIFLLKGSVWHCANSLYISESTLYRYLNKIKKEEGLE